MSSDELVKKRDVIVSRLTRLTTYINGINTTNINQFALQVKGARLEECSKELTVIQDGLDGLCKNDAELKIQLKAREQLEEEIENLEIRFRELYKPPTSSSSSQSKGHADHNRLPKMDPPTFDGHIQNWISFKDLFKATIHDNKTLSKAQKLTFFKLGLTGEAARLVKSLSVTDANYDIAWSQLAKRYDNNRELLFSILRRFLGQIQLPGNSSVAVRSLVDTSNGCIQALKGLSIPVEHWDAIIMYHMYQKLDQQTRELWEQKLNNSNIPPLSDFMEFLEQRACALAAAGCITKQDRRDGQGVRPQLDQNARRVNQVHHVQETNQCKVCSNAIHPIFRCPKFLGMSVPERTDEARKLSLCFCCLREGHSVSRCTSSGCRTCGKKHSSLLHRVSNNAEVAAPAPTAINNQELNQGRRMQVPMVFGNHTSDIGRTRQAMLATARIRVRDRHGRNQLCRAFLDNGATTSFITEACVNRLGLFRKHTTAIVEGLASAPIGTAKGVLTISFKPHFESNDVYELSTLILPKITSRLPVYASDPRVWPHLEGLELADPEFYRPAEIDILIGADLFWILLTDGRRIGPDNTPVGVRSTLGWLVGGCLDSASQQAAATVCYADTDFDNLQRFWELETISATRALTKEEQDCESHFQSTHKVCPDGRFMVKLPFKTSSPSIGSSRDMAIRRFKQVERRLVQKPEMKKQYIEFMREYESLGHMVQVQQQFCVNQTSYIPHHFVLKESSSTTKFRVVFDASAKTSNGVALNDEMMVGPALQDNIWDILLRFRKHPVAFTADIAKMYRQILVTPADTELQRIVWRENPEDPLKEFRLLTVTYGTASAPYLATKCLQQLATSNMDSLPVAATMVLDDMFVDDLMSGTQTDDDALVAQAQLLTLMSSSKFSLRKWVSNSEIVLNALPPEMRETQTLMPIDGDPTVKTLGVFWNPASDEYLFKINTDIINLNPDASKFTKRILLSEISKIFDPMGWLAPVVIKARILIQQLWKLQLEWDDILPVAVQNEWLVFKSTFHLLEQIRMPRCIMPIGHTCVNLVGFCDASEKAYAGVVYLVVQFADRPPVISLITSKTRVAPTKIVRLVKLELCGAVLLAQLITAVKSALKIQVNNTFAWTDSSVVLAYINAHPSRWITFVANRVTEVQAHLPASSWGHVSGKENPADCASRGIDPLELISHPLWWTGPEWIASRQPCQHIMSPDLDLQEYEKKQKVICSNTGIKEEEESILCRYSSLRRLLRISAWVLRFICNCRIKVQLRKDPTSIVNLNQQEVLVPIEVEVALSKWVLLIQQQQFSLEIQCIKKNQSLPVRSPLTSLNPFLDSVGVLRVGGRLRHAKLPENQKNPILLPKNHRFTQLLIMSKHLENFHAGPQLLLSILHRQFWIMGSRDAVRFQLKKCVVCTRHRGTTLTQFMGDLPSARVTPARAFEKCGIDYAGPFILKSILSRSKVTFKAYLALFVCFTTRAIHLEVVSSLSTESFLAALQRFTSRRGRPTDIYSDCGTNFVGAAKELKEVISLMKSTALNEQVANQLCNQGTQWHFNPPGAPHFGGLWEAGVKSVKYHLHRVIGSTRLNFEELTTTMTQIEACLNSRPLTPQSTDPNDLTVLTPGHFLIGAPLTALSERDLTPLNVGRLSRWQLVQQMFQHFWHRWSSEYISRLQQRPKWLKQRSNIKVQDLVLIKDDRLPPLLWKLGRVTELHPGADGLVRTVTLKTAEGNLKRPIVKLCLLPIDSSITSSDNELCDDETPVI